MLKNPQAIPHMQAAAELARFDAHLYEDQNRCGLCLNSLDSIIPAAVRTTRGLCGVLGA
jgi:hypothetical protein